MAAFRRRDGEGFGVEVFAEAEVDAGSKELAGEVGIAAEAVNRPLCGGGKAFLGGKQKVEGSDAMNRDGQTVFFRKGDVLLKKGGLHGEVGGCGAMIYCGVAPEGIETALPYCHDLRMCEKGIKIGKNCFVGLSSPPRVDAGGVVCVGARCERITTENDCLRQRDDGIVGLKVVRVEVGNVHQGTGS